VREMMLRKQQFHFLFVELLDFCQLLIDQSLEKHFLLEPDRNSGDERGKSLRNEGIIRFQKPLKFEQRLIIEGNGIELVDGCATIFQAEFHRIGWKIGIVFLAGKTFLLSCCDDFAILNYGGGRVMIKRRDS
jgi:hypothetical protein